MFSPSPGSRTCPLFRGFPPGRRVIVGPRLSARRLIIVKNEVPNCSRRRDNHKILSFLPRIKYLYIYIGSSLCVIRSKNISGAFVFIPQPMAVNAVKLYH